jgi:hypothetical protein
MTISSHSSLLLCLLSHRIATLVLKAVERATERGDSTPVVDAVERNVQWEATVHGPIVGHYAAERTFFCDVTPPSKDPVHRDDDAASAEPAVLTAAVAAASAAKAAAIKEARGADAERQYDDVVDNTSEVSAARSPSPSSPRLPRATPHLPPPPYPFPACGSPHDATRVFFLFANRHRRT